MSHNEQSPASRSDRHDIYVSRRTAIVGGIGVIAVAAGIPVAIHGIPKAHREQAEREYDETRALFLSEAESIAAEILERAETDGTNTESRVDTNTRTLTISKTTIDQDDDSITHVTVILKSDDDTPLEATAIEDVLPDLLPQKVEVRTEYIYDDTIKDVILIEHDRIYTSSTIGDDPHDGYLTRAHSGSDISDILDHAHASIASDDQ